MKKTGFLPQFVFAGLAVTFRSMAAAKAHIDIGDDYECSGSYEKDCFVMPPSNKKLKIFFDGTPQEYGTNCEYQTLRFDEEIVRAEKALGVERGAISFNGPHVRFWGSTGQPTHLPSHSQVWIA